jgi:hypothetical protein
MEKEKACTLFLTAGYVSALYLIKSKSDTSNAELLAVLNATVALNHDANDSATVTTNSTAYEPETRS